MYMAKRIHIVEDDEDIRYIVCYILVEMGYEVVLADSISDFREQPPLAEDTGLFLLDVMLPDGNGLDLCLELKKSPATQHIPVIIMSAHATETQVIQQACADEFIAKPFDLDEITNMIKKHIL
ncbi:Response regulator receiver domain-containing protein [Pedobacter westerhofensis]|uniref:Response regulator receiver domain-containing protein n=2 Tax=Pedobacter westerhofensis TaxID=425512 RepID=A0A521FNL2_9SPHI|nr:Response regulator receiver domain-containing protein [Pedobacter westerhofensis]